MNRHMEVDKDSMLGWYPKIKDLPIPMPRTEIIKLNEKEIEGYWKNDSCCLDRLHPEAEKIIARHFDFPVFIRTDEFSAKHGWKDTCFVDGLSKLKSHIFEVIIQGRCADLMGLQCNALVIREFIPMDTKFEGCQGAMPVNPERRYFIKDGKLICHHPYWIEAAVESGSRGVIELPDNWKELLAEANRETKEEVELLSKYAQLVAGVLPEGFWSIDFCKSKDGTWYLIDMATGERSWHPDTCPNCPKDQIRKPPTKEEIAMNEAAIKIFDEI